MLRDMVMSQYIARLDEEERELEKKLAELRNAKSHAKRVLEIYSKAIPTNDGGDDTETEDKGKITVSGPYNGLGVEEAAAEHLRAVGVEQKTAQVRDALLAGGINTEAEYFHSTVFSALDRLAARGEVQKVGAGRWRAAVVPDNRQEGELDL